MSPTLDDGDFLVAIARGRIKRGSVVVVRHPERPDYEMVKRVTRVPGDAAGARLGPQEYWVVGDDPDRSTDSRSFGPVARSQIAGVVRLRYWPLARLTWFP